MKMKLIDSELEKIVFVYGNTYKKVENGQD